jgi:hypothetical protein
VPRFPDWKLAELKTVGLVQSSLQGVVPPPPPQTLAVPPPPQVCGAVQVPQEETVRGAPQLSVPETEPQFLPRRAQNWAFVSGVQLVPQTLGVPPPPQVCGAVQVPQEETVRGAPQLSVPETEPQVLPRRVQNWAFVSGVQAVPQTLGVPPSCRCR